MSFLLSWNPISVCLVLSVAALWTWALMLVRQGKSAEAEQLIENVVTRVLAKRMPPVTEVNVLPPSPAPSAVGKEPGTTG